jgi:hypothetical protein
LLRTENRRLRCGTHSRDASGGATKLLRRWTAGLLRHLPMPLAEAKQDDGIPLTLRRRYLVADDHKYYFRDRDQALAFEDLGNRLRTEHDDPDVAISMVELAQAKGWDKIKISGSREFKREAWLAAAERGLHTRGHRPSAADRASSRAHGPTRTGDARARPCQHAGGGSPARKTSPQR